MPVAYRRSRRHFGTVVVAGALALGTFGARAQRFPVILGCCLRAGQMEEISPFVHGLAGVGQGLISTTGDPSLDRALGRAIVRLSGQFNERPGFGFINDSGRPNAYASPEHRVTGTWGTVMFGQELFRDLLKRYDDDGMAILAVIAHEFGHIAQFRSGVYARLLTGQATVRRIELNADFLAGYYLGSRKIEDSSLKVWAAGDTLYRIGDYQFNNRDHHGTPEQRVAAAEAGFKLGYDRTPFDSAFRQGAEYALRF